MISFLVKKENNEIINNIQNKNFTFIRDNMVNFSLQSHKYKSKNEFSNYQLDFVNKHKNR